MSCPHCDCPCELCWDCGWEDKSMTDEEYQIMRADLKNTTAKLSHRDDIRLNTTPSQAVPQADGYSESGDSPSEGGLLKSGMFEHLPEWP